ncbi:MAG TPA: aminoglycoside adenylyltransferase domain-containing protein [Chloroflexota bacterium]|nr:aminoglycoside adenylyltransferase domain-containing protein [Chloroflexota bacterium]
MTTSLPFEGAGPTPYPDVNGVLRGLIPRVMAALGEQFRGIYLFGSLVSGDFDPRRSDVDVLGVVDDVLSAERFAALSGVHRDLAASKSPWAVEVEAYYLTEAALRREDPSFGCHLKVNRGNGGVLEPLHRDRGWLIQGHLLREFGVALVGPDPRTLIAPVAPGDLRRTIAASAPEWLAALLADPTELRRSGSHTYLVLTLCRVLYTLANDAVASKQVAGRWAQAELGDRWAALIGSALAWRKDLPTREIAEGDFAETVELLRFVLARCRGS